MTLTTATRPSPVDILASCSFSIAMICSSLTLGPLLAGAGVVVAAATLEAALNAAIQVVRLGTRAMDGAVEGVMDLRRRIEIRPVTQGPNGIPEATGGRGENFDYDIPSDLTEAERNIMGESRSGTTEPDADHDTADRADADAPGEHLNDDGSLKREFWGKNPDWDLAEIRRRVGEERWGLLEVPGRGGRSARDSLITEFHRQFDLSDEATNIRGSAASDAGMDLARAMRLVVYPPPSVVRQWVGVRPDGSKIRGGNFFDPNAGGVSPNELGVNSVGRGQEEISLGRTRGIAFEGHGAEITDTWTLRSAGGHRNTEGGPPQWYVPQVYAEQMLDSRMTGTTWRDLPGNAPWVEAMERGDLRYNAAGGYWEYDGPPLPENGGYR